MVFFLELGCLCAETSGYIIMDEMAFLIQGLVGLGHHEVIFLVRGQVYNLIRYPWIGRVRGLIHHTVRRLDEAVLAVKWW